jgi:PKD repeat protein
LSADSPTPPSGLEVLAGRYVLRLGDPAGARIVGEESAGGVRSLSEAIAQARSARRPPVEVAISKAVSVAKGGAAAKGGAVAKGGAAAKTVVKAERAEERAEHATDKLEAVTEKLTQASKLITDLATGHSLDMKDMAGLADELLGLLRKLDREGHCEEALRVARCLAILLSLLKRWAELLDSLQTALEIATQLGDTPIRAWALHEQGTLHLAGEDYAPADKLLSEAHGLRQKIGDTHGARLTGENLQALCRALRVRLHERRSEKLMRTLNRPAPTFVLGALLLISGGVLGVMIRGSGRTSSHLLANHTAEIVIGAIPRSPRAGAPVAFTARVVGGEGARYEWRFGDGGATSAAAPTHVYRRSGSYEAKLTVSNARGAILGRGTIAVYVRPEASSTEPPPPRASFSFSPASAAVGQDVSFNAASSSDPDPSASIVSYVWRFGDGTTQRGPKPTHHYDKPGMYTAELVIADTREASASTRRKLIVKATTPSAPINVLASPSDGSATVRWSAPGSNGGSAVSSYTITPYVGDKANTATTVSSGTSATVEHLANGTAYTFTVTAANSAGKGPASGHSNAVTPAAKPSGKSASKPSVPTGVSASPGDSSATVTWMAPTNDGGDAIVSYTVTPYVGSEARTATEVSGATTAKVDDLSNGTTYTFTVAATNSLGEGQQSQPSNPVTPTSATPRPTVPSAPSDVSASAGDGRASVSWSAPGSNGGSAIAAYTVTPYVGEEAKTATTVSSGTSAIVEHLANGTAYTFTVSASNAVGSGNPSERSPPVTPAGVPSAPPRIAASAGEEEDATVSWAAPASEGSPIAHYIITAYSENSTDQASETTGGARTLTIHGLSPGKPYTFTVAAVNGVGVGNASEHSNEVTIKSTALL